jgi:hypothetical protein
LVRTSVPTASLYVISKVATPQGDGPTGVEREMAWAPLPQASYPDARVH